MKLLPISSLKSIRLSTDKPARILLALQVALAASPLLFPMQANAAEMTNAYVRLDRMSVSQATGGTICVKPAATHTTSISDLTVTFPLGDGSTTGYTVNATAANWTVDTLNLPTGTSAFPNIDTATSANATTNVVVFPTSSSATLTGGTVYCFNFASVNTLTSRSTAASDLQGSMTLTDTTPASNETKSFATATITSGTDQLAVSASVPATFSFALTAGNHALGSLSTSSVTSSGTPSTATVSTNAKNGWLAWVKSANAALSSTITGTSISAGAYQTGSGNVVDLASTTGYVLDATTGTGAPTIATEFGGNGTSSGGKLDTLFEQVASNTVPVSGDTFTMNVRAKVAGTQAAATDYTDTLTVVAAGQF